jgi:hypothetical protein
MHTHTCMHAYIVKSHTYTYKDTYAYTPVGRHLPRAVSAHNFLAVALAWLYVKSHATSDQSVRCLHACMISQIHQHT